MAEAVLGVVIDNLSSLIQKELGLFLGFEKDFKSVSSLLTTIKATLEDAEEKQFTNRAIKDWLLKLKDAAYVLDDILDECATNALELEYKGSTGGLHGKLQSSCLSSLHPKQVAFRYKIAKKMKSIRERLDEIAEEKTKFHLTEVVREKRIGVLDWRQTTSIISQPQVYGRDQDKDKIVDFLVEVSSSIGHLKCLRYLDLSDGKFETLPESICKLWNLQNLKLDNCYSLLKLPKNMIHLKALQHLSLNQCERLSSLPPQIGKMISLKTLSMYVVGKGNLLAELRELNFKVDKLYIKHLERVKSVEDAKEANMCHKHVNNLRLAWGEESQLQDNVEQILEVLQPYNQQLQELGVEGYTGSYFPEWMSSPSLIRLRSLFLKNCKSCLHLPQLGKLPSLEVLKLYQLPNLTSLPESIGNLSSLQTLDIDKCPKLICLPASVQSLTDLKSLIIWECDELEKRCKRETGEDWPKISHIQNLYGDCFW